MAASSMATVSDSVGTKYGVVGEISRVAPTIAPKNMRWIASVRVSGPLVTIA